MKNRSPTGLTGVEIGVIGVICCLSLSILLIPGRSCADGTFYLHLKVDGPLPGDQQVQYRVVSRRRLVMDSKTELLEELWYVPLVEQDNEAIVPIHFSIHTRFNAFTSQSWTLYPDRLIVKYTVPNKPPRYRVLPIPWRQSGNNVELTVPREPPSDSEAWKPQ